MLCIKLELASLAVITGNFCMLTVIDDKLAAIKDIFRKLGVAAGEFHMLTIITSEF